MLNLLWDSKLLKLKIREAHSIWKRTERKYVIFMTWERSRGRRNQSLFLDIHALNYITHPALSLQI